jgi:hypothetical protein
MAILLTTSLIFAFFAFYFLFRMFHSIRHRRVMRAGGSCLSCLGSAGVAGIGGMLLISYLSYERLIEEMLVSRVEFTQTAADEFEARLMVPGEMDQVFVLRGDEWQMDAKIVTWKPPMTVLGLDPIYQLDRLSGRYGDIGREQNEARTVHALTPESPTDVWKVAHRFPLLLPGVDAHYGTATYVPMVDGARFAVMLSRDALIARPDNDRAREAISSWTGN